MSAVNAGSSSRAQPGSAQRGQRQERDAVHGARIGDHRTAAVAQRQIGQADGEVPSLALHPLPRAIHHVYAAEPDVGGERVGDERDLPRDRGRRIPAEGLRQLRSEVPSEVVRE